MTASIHSAQATLSSLVNQDVESIRSTHPIIHSVTNVVTMSTIANVLLALGASPIMAHAKDELADIVKIANALVINLGTLDTDWIKSMQIAQAYALTKKMPIIFDPVGAGATAYRTQTAKWMLQAGIHIMRGNASEIMSLIDDNMVTKGVDAQHDSKNAITAALLLSKTYNCTVVISGETDIVVSDNQLAFIQHGTPLFTKVTGMGCAVTALIGAFAAVNTNYFLAAAHAMATFSLAGEIAARKSHGCGSFYPNLLDTLSLLNETDFHSLKIKYSSYGS